jgi:hypothetical protein
MTRDVAGVLAGATGAGISREPGRDRSPGVHLPPVRDPYRAWTRMGDGVGFFFNGPSSFGPWFDPLLFRGARRYGGAVFLALAVPVLVIGVLWRGWLAGLLGLVVLWIGCTWGADRLADRRDAHRDARRRSAMRTCTNCGEETFAATCPLCGTAAAADSR